MMFACPVDKRPLRLEPPKLVCDMCGINFPIVNGVPVLINDANSVFRVSDYTGNVAYEGASGYGGSLDQVAGWRKAYRRFARRLSEAELPGSDGIDAIAYVLSRVPDAAILVVGAGEQRYAGRVTYTDVAFAAGIACICDAHDLPFEAGRFDAVFAISVLEHVCDPQRCVAEFARVLKPQGYVMAATPFLQSVHMGAHDFTRFAYLGHRRLFRLFGDIESGMYGDPAYSAIHLMRNLATSVSDRPRLRSVMRLMALLATYPMRHLDQLLFQTQGAYNSACAFYFFGQRRDVPMPDRDMIALFRGR